MGRSVSYPSGSILKEYIDTSSIEDDFEWAEFKDDLKSTLMSKYKSLSPCESNTWAGNEDLALLENDLVYIGISDYCGLSCVWVIPKNYYEEYEGLALNWCHMIEKSLFKLLNANYSTLFRIGGFSDGTSVYQRREVIN